MTDPLARLLSSFATAVLGLGLPTVRDWLRERMGATAHVTGIRESGGAVHLEGVELPLGPGLALLERAVVEPALPEVRLQSFEGELVFGSRVEPAFRARIAFTSDAEVDADVRASGELTLDDVVWTARPESPPASALRGRVHLAVTKTGWRLEGGRLDGEHVRAHFGGASTFDAPLPSVATLRVEHAKLGPLADVAAALAGRPLALPAGLPLDAAVDGELAWTREDGGRVDLRASAAMGEGTVRGLVSPAALALDVDAQIRPAALLPREATPREEDALAVSLRVEGAPAAPVVRGTLRAEALGFRLGRPRFVPAVVLRAAEGEVTYDGVLTARLTAFARERPVHLEVSGPDVVVRAEALEAAFVRDVLRALDVPLPIPDDTRTSVDVMLAPARDGTVTLKTDASVLAYDVGAGRLTGRLAIADAVRMDLFQGSVRPATGDVTVDLDRSLTGTLAAKELGLVVGDRVHPLANASVAIAIAKDAVRYERLVFEAHGARFEGRGVLPGAEPLTLRLVEGGPALAQAFVDAPWLPADLTGHGELVVRPHGHLRFALALATPRRRARASAELHVGASGLTWRALHVEAFGGTIEGAGHRRRDGSLLARVVASRVALHDLPELEGRQPASYARGALSGMISLRGDTSCLDAEGAVRIDDGAFPLIDRARPALERYGLRPPNEDATGPATANVRALAGTWSIADIAVPLHGATVRGAVSLSPARALEGKADVVLEETYLRTSKVLTLPRVFAHRLSIPVTLSGTTAAPKIHAELGEAFGHFLKDNRFLSKPPPPPAAPPPSSIAADVDRELAAILAATF